MNQPDSVVDLRSDTITRPTPAMREAIAAAVVGDDTLGDDPTVNRLQEVVAERLGKEAALFFPSGIMANQTAIKVIAAAGTEVVCEAHAHVFDWEDGAPADLSRVALRLVPTSDGLLTPELVDAAIRTPNPFQSRTALVCLENTHNSAGGRIMPLDQMAEIREVSRRHGVPIHLDGARLWNASVATGVAEAQFAAQVDTVMVSLSKGLGCPVGALLAGPSALIRDAWRIRRRFGGSMRQAGILAAAGLYALDHHRDRLAQDHANARLLARLATAVPGVSVVNPETNIVMIDLVDTELDAPAIAERLGAAGVRLSVFSARRLRAVTHLDVDEAGVRRAVDALADIVRRGA